MSSRSTPPAEGFFLYSAGGQSAREAAQLAIQANGRDTLRKLLMKYQQGASDRTSGATLPGFPFDLNEFLAAVESDHPADNLSTRPSPGFSVARILPAVEIPSGWGVYGSAVNDRMAWSMAGMFIELKWCSASGCTTIDRVDATTLKLNPGTNGLRMDISHLDRSTSDHLTQVHHQTWIYKGGANYTAVDNCAGSDLCFNSANWDSGYRQYGVPGRAINGAYGWYANQMWGHHAAKNVWVSSRGKTREAYCAYTSDPKGKPNPCKF